MTGRRGPGERAVGTICIQLLWYDKEVGYEHVTLLASTTLLACAALIGGDLSTQSSHVDAKWIINSYAISLSSLQYSTHILCTHTHHATQDVISTFDQWKQNHLSDSCEQLNVSRNILLF